MVSWKRSMDRALAQAENEVALLHRKLDALERHLGIKYEDFVTTKSTYVKRNAE